MKAIRSFFGAFRAVMLALTLALTAHLALFSTQALASMPTPYYVAFVQASQPLDPVATRVLEPVASITTARCNSSGFFRT